MLSGVRNMETKQVHAPLRKRANIYAEFGVSNASSSQESELRNKSEEYEDPSAPLVTQASAPNRKIHSEMYEPSERQVEQGREPR